MTLLKESIEFIGFWSTKSLSLPIPHGLKSSGEMRIFHKDLWKAFTLCKTVSSLSPSAFISSVAAICLLVNIFAYLSRCDRSRLSFRVVAWTSTPPNLSHSTWIAIFFPTFKLKKLLLFLLFSSFKLKKFVYTNFVVNENDEIDEGS